MSGAASSIDTLSWVSGHDRLYFAPLNVPAGGGGTTASTVMAAGSTTTAPPSAFGMTIRSPAQKIECGLPTPSGSWTTWPVVGSSLHRWPEPDTSQTELPPATGVDPHAGS